MKTDDHRLRATLTLHEAVVEARRRGAGDGPSYQWAYGRVMSGLVAAEKIGARWRLPPEAVDVLTALWRARHRSSCGM
jgi:hypothetical protein